MLSGTRFLFGAVSGICLAMICHDVAAQNTNRQLPANRAGYQRTVSGMSGGRGARQVAGGASLSGLRTGLSAFAADMGRMPTSAEGLNALIVRPPGAKNWRGPYISTTNAKPPFADPWGMQYRYIQTPVGRTYIHTIASNGPDRVAGTRDDLQVQF